MAVISIKKGQVLFTEGSPVSDLYLLLKGSVSLTFSCGEYTLSKGEVIGICEVQSAAHFMTCTALEDTAAIVYPFTDAASLDTMFQNSPDCCSVFVRSAFRQMNMLLPPFTQSIFGSNAAFLEKDSAIPAGLITALSGSLNKIISSTNALTKLQETCAAEAEEDAAAEELDTTGAEMADADSTADIRETPSADAGTILSQTAGSLRTILDYAEADNSFALHFKELINQYRHCSDRSAADDSTRTLRLHITKQFYELYQKIFFRAVKEDTIPLPVRMFLYFGYVDEELAEEENTIVLGQLAEYLHTHTHEHVFTLFDWLRAIYDGTRKPSRNEFEQDYTDYLFAQKAAKNISTAQFNELSVDATKKVEYELQNMVPVVNKITYGRISSFCPVFSAHNMLKKPVNAFVTAKALEKYINHIRGLDYSAFYREYLYSNTAAGIPKENFHMEVLPDIILMPNAGNHGVMWQEIEGKHRNTPARMMLSVFYLEELYPAVVRLVGEYRWEMCRRVQGAHWNDLGDRSLTSEYFDYMQFFKKNHDLSPEAKEKLKTALQKARGSFKEMFVRDYVSYILFESAASPRLTKPARTILFTYCPFSRKVRDKLAGNPIYKENLDYYNLKNGQILHRLDLLTRKLESCGMTLPKELLDEHAFYDC